ncbi:hypothetical protein CN679_22405 [Bacillus pseudomycoides]|nr:hypothetical protein COO02_10540 [Bacillus pseudomycoides]PEI87328.1 hypothetical protein CN679_22405 [Bacillus pseudomycoides]
MILSVYIHANRKNNTKPLFWVGESVRPCIEAVRAFFSPMPSENKGRKRVEILFYFHSRDLYVEKSKWICILFGYTHEWIGINCELRKKE